jgi:hypothetical protein
MKLRIVLKTGYSGIRISLNISGCSGGGSNIIWKSEENSLFHLKMKGIVTGGLEGAAGLSLITREIIFFFCYTSEE